MNPVIKLQWLKGGVALVVMEDRQSKNRFSPAFMEGMTAVLEEINANEEARVVLIHGYDGYFCCGGTREELMQISSGEANFTDFPFFDGLLRCKVPVVAAMQGHAIGGGLVFGAYADIVILAEEALYGANFMHYGFTPGMGGTWVIPKKFGTALGWEMLFSARNYHGGELRDRGVPFQVVKRSEVIPKGLAIARSLAEKPAIALRELKHCFYESVCAEQRAAVAKEVAMHKVTFTRPEVIDRINQLYAD